MFANLNKNYLLDCRTRMTTYFCAYINEVRQGGILSLLLFAVSINDFSSLIHISRISIYIIYVCINDVFCDEDLCIMLLS